jgi:BlaI family transcriptional regulator, penicillinase repressor
MARKRAPDQLTPLELEIMKVLWETGPAVVTTVQQRLPPERALAYTSVQTMLNVLHRKGKVKRALKDRAYWYKPVVSRTQAARHAMGDLIDRMFGGSAESLVLSLVEARQLSPERLAELARAVDESLAKEKEPHDGSD